MTKDNATPHTAAEYDLSVRQTIPFYEEIQAEVVDLVKTAQPDVKWWFDTGCGTGYLVALASAAFPRTRFVLADPSEQMLEQARSRLAARNGPRWRFLEPIGNGELAGRLAGLTPQVTTAILCHHYLRPAQRRQALRACHDTLSDGGLFVTVENVAPLTEDGTSIGLARWKRRQLRLGRSEPVVDDHLTRFGTKYFPITIDEHVRLMKEVGFRVVEPFWLSQMQVGLYGLK